MEKNYNNKVRCKIIELITPILSDKKLKKDSSIYLSVNNLIVIALNNSNLLFFEKEKTITYLFLLDKEELIRELSEIMHLNKNSYPVLYFEYDELTENISLILETGKEKILILDKNELSCEELIIDLNVLFRRLNNLSKNIEIKIDKKNLSWVQYY